MNQTYNKMQTLSNDILREKNFQRHAEYFSEYKEKILQIAKSLDETNTEELSRIEELPINAEKALRGLFQIYVNLNSLRNRTYLL